MITRAFVRAHFVELVTDWLEESTNGARTTCVQCGRPTLRKRCASCDHAHYRKAARRARKQAA